MASGKKPATLKIRDYMQKKYGEQNAAGEKMVTWHQFDSNKHGDGAGFLKELCLKEEK